MDLQPFDMRKMRQMHRLCCVESRLIEEKRWDDLIAISTAMVEYLERREKERNECA